MSKHALKKTTATNAHARKHDPLKRAKTLETEAQLERLAAINHLAAMAETPEDRDAVLMDIFSSELNRATRCIARATGKELPPPPAPVSKLLTGFAEAVKKQLTAIGEQLSFEERARLAAVGSRVLESIDASEKDVVAGIATLLQFPPEWSAAWLKGHLDEIDARFAS